MNTNYLQQGAIAYHGSGDFSGWRSMDTAPRDGTPVELKCTYGVAPWYGVFKWTGKRAAHGPNGELHEFETEPTWVDARNPSMGVSDEGHLHWRPYNGAVASYVDPTGGMQNDDRYWRGAVAAKYGLAPDAFEEIAARNARKNEARRKPRVSIWHRIIRAIFGDAP